MEIILAILIVLLIIIVIVGIAFFTAKKKLSMFLNRYFHTTSLKSAIEISEIGYENTPKSLAGMDKIALPLIKSDFPNLNINELKGMVESTIISYFRMLENKEYEDIKYASEAVKSYIKSQVEDVKKHDDVVYDSIKIHKTVISKYEKKNGMAVLSFQTSLEYLHKKGQNSLKKIQDRISTEFIYIIDASEVNSKTKGIGLNCPNCGAPISNLGNKVCEYCGTGVVDLVKYTWLLNSIKKN